MHQNSAAKKAKVVHVVFSHSNENKMKQHYVFDELASSITRLLPEGAARMQEDLEANIKAALQAGLAKMNLVSREEFDIQVALLARSREKLEQLEQRLTQLLEKTQP